ncbi:MAG: efflux RND transporter periplasmic adaptor subunit [Betaproteobacteria bacterium]
MSIKYLGLIIFFLLTACDKPLPPLAPPRPALVMVVGATAISNAMVLVGEVRPRYESSQSFRIDGKVIARNVDVGALVKKGQVIARLDATDAHLSASAASADVRAAVATYELTASEVERQRQLFAKKFISASALDIREAELKTANARLAQIKAQANVSANQTQYTNLTADRDGVVTMIRAEPGQVIKAGEAIAKIADTKEFEVLVAVPESRMAEVKLNAAAVVKMWAYQQKSYVGVVREVAPAADSATRTFNVRVSIKNADEAVRLGMTAGVKFNPLAPQPLAQSSDQKSELPETELLIPNSALTALNGKKMVWVIDANNKAQPREVVAGQFREDGVLVTSGLQAGERIAIAGVHTLIKDQTVKPIFEDKPILDAQP